ncbi:hypothetical protein AR543_p0133 (plasmid) [Paenibacillus bovis]|uniref:DUF4320 domain-containing protein n=2 Tax=Paenibacillus bovis TaxID=1616788 RepID=A0A1X9T494_9BACL|nr:hypothetical protein AR543_p0133 [Paenibacillus bovis]
MLKRFINDESGELITTFIISVFISLILLGCGVTGMQYSIIKSNLKNGANETLQVMKLENGADTKTHQIFNDFMRSYGMDPTKITFTATPKMVQRGDRVEITVSTPYKLWILKVLGYDQEVTITAQASGLAHKFIR